MGMDEINKIESQEKLAQENNTRENSEKSNDDTIKYGIKDSIVLVVGNMIGGGIFMSPEMIAKKMGNAGITLLLWGFGGVIALLGAFCYVELGMIFPQSGGEGVYIAEAYHKYLSFVYYYGSFLLTIPGGLAFISQKATECLLYGWLKEKEENTKNVINIFSVVLVLLLGFLNWGKPYWSMKLGLVSMFFKFLSIIIILLTGMIRLIKGTKEDYKVPPNDTVNGPWYEITTICFVIMTAMWSYDGWNSINLIGSRVKNPRRTFPISIMTSIPLVALLYILINSVYLFVVPNSLLNSGNVNINFISAVLVHDLFGNVFGNFIFPVFVAIAIIGSLNGCLVCGAAIVQGAAEVGCIPKLFGKINKQGVPSNAVINQVFITILYIGFGSWIGPVFTYINLAMWIFYGLAVMAVIIMRYKKPNILRSFRVWTFVPFVFTLVGGTMVLVGIISFFLYDKTINPFFSE